VLNFTNPSGLVTQAVYDAGFRRIYGLCDMPSSLIREIAQLRGCKPENLETLCFGLNHLSFFSSVKQDGQEIVHDLLSLDDLYTATDMRYFSPDFARKKGMLLNEYLFYYFYPDLAFKNINKEPKSRGEIIEAINTQMVRDLSSADVLADLEGSLRIYEHYLGQRESQYMASETGKSKPVSSTLRFDPFEKDNNGYAGVALDLIEAQMGSTAKEIVLNLPNGDAIADLESNDIVEITCKADSSGVRPKRVGHVPVWTSELLRRVKVYERLAAKAILTHDRNCAVDALFFNPLVGSYSHAEALVDKFGERADKSGFWKDI
jgi:6-phospho-beta-glucosidase